MAATSKKHALVKNKNLKTKDKQGKYKTKHHEPRDIFDPMKDRHLWTMWRAKVNGRIREEIKAMKPADYENFPFGKALLEVPLNHLIKMDSRSMIQAEILRNPTNVNKVGLNPLQFIYYGLPRIVLANDESFHSTKATVDHSGHLDNSEHHSVKVLHNNDALGNTEHVISAERLKNGESLDQSDHLESSPRGMKEQRSSPVIFLKATL